MNHSARLAICELCENKSFSPKSGVICSLTSEKPVFETSCNDFSEDPSMVIKKRRLKESHDRMQENIGAGEEEASGGSPIRVILGIVAVVLLLLRILIRCDNTIG